MFVITRCSRPLWGPADEGAGGDAALAPGSQPAAGAPPASGAPPAAGADGADGADAKADSGPGQKSTLLDFAPKGDNAKPGDAAWKLPDGLEVPDHLLGTSAEETLRKLSTAYKGARAELSTRKREDGVLDGAVPKDIDGYKFEGDLEKDPILKDLASEESKPIVDAWRKAALEVGIPDAAFAKFMHTGIAKMQEAGLQVGLNPEQAMQINGEAEMEGLVQALGKAGADMALRQLDSFAQKLAERKILSSKEDVAEFGQMVGTARAAQIMQRIITAEFGEQAIPPGDPIEGGVTIEEAYQMQREALSISDATTRQEAVERADAALAKALAQGSTPGQVRSRVL